MTTLGHRRLGLLIGVPITPTFITGTGNRTVLKVKNRSYYRTETDRTTAPIQLKDGAKMGALRIDM